MMFYTKIHILKLTGDGPIKIGPMATALYKCITFGTDYSVRSQAVSFRHNYTTHRSSIKQSDKFVCSADDALLINDTAMYRHNEKDGGVKWWENVKLPESVEYGIE